jgi:hypothetical protein
MSFRHAVLLCAAALIPQFALAGNAPSIAHGAPLMSKQSVQKTPAPVAQEIGLVDGLFDFCAKVDPADKAQLERKRKQMLPKLSEDRLQAVRHGAEYHAAYGMVQSVFQGLSNPDAVRNCSAIR